MKKVISLILIFVLMFALVSCAKNDEVTDKSGGVDDYGGESVSAFSGIIIEIGSEHIMVEPDAESNEAKSADRISVSLAGITLDAKVGDRVAILYKGGIAESYPAQINDVISVEVIYDWGITLTAKNVTLSGATIVCAQSGGEITGELNTGEEYFIEVKNGDTWEPVPTVIDDYGWDSVAYMVTLDGTTVWDVNWDWLYGELENGTYRLGKGFMDFRETGDYDNAFFYAEFVITDDTAQTSSDLVICD